MKRIFALTLAFLMLLPLCACASQSLNADIATEEKKTAEENKTEQETGPIVYPEGFSVGYSRIDITPTSWPTLFYNGEYADSAHDRFVCADDLSVFHESALGFVCHGSRTCMQILDSLFFPWSASAQSFAVFAAGAVCAGACAECRYCGYYGTRQRYLYHYHRKNHV